MRRIILATTALVLLVAATPIAAQLAGTWVGTGTGNAYPSSGVVIYPWQEWKGEIPDAEDVFVGEWQDSLGNHGTFKGAPVPSPIPEERCFDGEWTWYSPESDIPIVGGKFKITFWFLEGYCNGNWTTIWLSTSDRTTMIGWKVD
jgi:hypothetical protein